MLDDLKHVSENFFRAMDSLGFSVDDFPAGRIYEKGWRMNVKTDLNGPWARVEFAEGDYGSGEGIYFFVPGALESKVSSMRDIISGIRLLNEIDYWANANGAAVDRKVELEFVDGDNRRKTDIIFSKYKLNAELHKKLD